MKCILCELKSLGIISSSLPADYTIKVWETADMIFMGEKIRELRTEKKMTQEQLANRLGLVKGSISAYEQGTKYPSLEVLVNICQIFNVSADYLLGLSDDRMIKSSVLTDEQTKLLRGLIKEFEMANARFD